MLLQRQSNYQFQFLIGRLDLFRTPYFFVFANEITSNIENENSNLCVNQAVHSFEGNLRWYKIRVANVSLYAQMEEFAILDGYKRGISFNGPSKNNEVIVNIPFFWHNLTLDPNFGLLLEDSNNDPCGDSFITSLAKDSKTWKFYLIIPVAVIILVLGFLVWKYDRFRLWNRFRSSLQNKPAVVHDSNTQM